MPRYQLTAETKEALRFITNSTIVIVQLVLVLEMLPLSTSQTTYLIGPKRYNKKIVDMYVYMYMYIYIYIWGAEKCIHILRDVIYVLLFEVELNYGSNV